ncbi:hydrolase [Streptomyces sp. ZAF1911]|uniref:hydrolase n=1 Tax=unclassified Streptomyces TaxID=2593676 RepID=UPI00237B8D08|nr:hydrolase [Streptomyces sp. ZAF1911]MDD9381254.1 hydrolase [Streptomyces sp. ZAF1911]
MPATQLDARTALVLIDLQNGILAMPAARPSQEVLAQGVRLADAFRAKQHLVVLVRVDFSPDGGDLLRSRADQAHPPMRPPADFAEFPTELGPKDGDIVITKRQWGAFTGTELDLQLRRRGITQIVLAGVATTIGVESTARFAYELGYHLTFAQDAMTDPDADGHTHTVTKVFPRIGEVDTTERIIDLLGT